MTYTAMTIMSLPKVGFRISVRGAQLIWPWEFSEGLGASQMILQKITSNTKLAEGLKFFSELPKYSGSPESIKTFRTPVMVARVIKPKHNHVLCTHIWVRNEAETF